MKESRYYAAIMATLLILLSPYNIYSEKRQEKDVLNNTNTSSSASNLQNPDMGFPREELPDWKVRWELAKVLGYVKRYQEALSEYEKLLKEKPDLLEAKIEMAKILYWSGQQNKALKVFATVPLDRLDEDEKITMADIYTAIKQYKKAEPIYREFLERHPENLRIRLKFAEILSWEKRYDESLIQYEIIIKARPGDIQIKRKYAFVLTWAGRHNDAILELRKTLDQ